MKKIKVIEVVNYIDSINDWLDYSNLKRDFINYITNEISSDLKLNFDENDKRFQMTKYLSNKLELKVKVHDDNLEYANDDEDIFNWLNKKQK